MTKNLKKFGDQKRMDVHGRKNEHAIGKNRIWFVWKHLGIGFVVKEYAGDKREREDICAPRWGGVP